MTHPKPDGLDALKREAVSAFRNEKWRHVSYSDLITATIDHLAQRGMLNCGWMDIESAPRDELILITNIKRDKPTVFVAYHSEAHSGFRRGPRFKEDGGFYNIEATHWMPLPAAPKMEGVE